MSGEVCCGCKKKTRHYFFFSLAEHTVRTEGKIRVQKKEQALSIFRSMLRCYSNLSLSRLLIFRSSFLWEHVGLLLNFFTFSTIPSNDGGGPIHLLIICGAVGCGYICGRGEGRKEHKKWSFWRLWPIMGGGDAW